MRARENEEENRIRELANEPWMQAQAEDEYEKMKEKYRETC